MSTQAQNYRAYARRYGMEEGLPHRQVNNLIQDRKGFIWAATSGGVVRFDGYRFKIFNHTESGLAGDIVDWVAEDADGYIWACRIGGNAWLNIIDPVSGTVHDAAEFFKDSPLPVHSKRFAWPPHQWADGTLALAYSEPGGYLLYHPRRGWRRIDLPIPNCTNFEICRVTEQKRIWGVAYTRANNAHCLTELDTAGQILFRYQAPPGAILHTKTGQTGETDGFYLLEYIEAIYPLALWAFETNRTRTPVATRGARSWVLQYARLPHSGILVEFPYILDSNEKLLLDIQHQFPEIDSLQYRGYLVDRNGNLWFATTFGLVVVELREEHFDRLLYQEKAPGGRGYACRGLIEKNGKLTVNTELNHSGRFVIDLKTKVVTRIGDSGLGLAESADGNIWSDAGRESLDFEYISIVKTTPAGAPLGSPILHKRGSWGRAWSILEESPERVLLGHQIGLSVLDPLTGAVRPWESDTVSDLEKAVLTHLGRDRSGRIWACTERGLYLLKPGGGVQTRYWSGGKGAHFLPYDNIYHFYEDADGIFWLGTAGGGLLRWDPKAPAGQHTRTISRKDGLLNGVVYAIYEDAHEHLWLPTDYGIVQFDKKNLQVRHTWLETDGLAHNEFNRVSHCRGSDGTLYFGGLNGVTTFQPNDFYQKNQTGGKGKTLVVSDFSVLNGNNRTPINQTADLLASNQITMRPGDRYVQLEFALLEYTAPEKVTYNWQLEGISGDWEPLKEPILRLLNLPLGTHRLRIRARAADGTWAGNELDIRLRVVPPFYLRVWFLCLVLCLLAAGIWGWLSWRTRQHRLEQERLETEVARQTATIRRQTEELKQLDAAKSRFFANVSHELRTPLTLILGPLGSLLKGNRLERRDAQYASTAHQHGEQLLGLVNELLDLSKMESGKMKLHETTVLLQPFLRRVLSAFESHAERLGISFVFDYALPERLRVLLDEDKLQKVLNNLLSNALKFTPPQQGGSVVVRAGESDGHLQVAVRDTGRGIHPDDLPHVFERFYQTAQADAPLEGGTGIGLALCREFAALMGGRIWVESTLGEGSTFYFEFPKKEVLGVGAELADEPLAMTAVSVATLQDASVVPSNTGQPTLLVVEDNDSMRDYISAVLSGQYKVVTAENGQVALDLLQGVAQRPDLIVSDIMMPLLDGFQLLERLKDDDRWRHIPVVMLTARADIRDKLRALRIGVDDYLLKPFEEDELLARVENLLKNRQGRLLDAPPGDLGDDAPASIEDLEMGTMPQQALGVPVPISREEQEWLEQLEQMVAKGVGDSRLSADWLAHQLFVGRNLFFKKVKRLTGMTPNEYIQEVRLTQARYLLEARAYQTVKEAAYAVGIKDVKYFSEQFKKRFGKLPSEYR